MKPPEKLTNKFGQRTGDHYWSLYRDAANDDSYDDSLADDLEAVKQKHPGLVGDADPDGWVNDLTSLDELAKDCPPVDVLFEDSKG